VGRGVEVGVVFIRKDYFQSEALLRFKWTLPGAALWCAGLPSPPPTSYSYAMRPCGLWKLVACGLHFTPQTSPSRLFLVPCFCFLRLDTGCMCHVPRAVNVPRATCEWC
jgi:hypothetical protein